MPEVKQITKRVVLPKPIRMESLVLAGAIDPHEYEQADVVKTVSYWIEEVDVTSYTDARGQKIVSIVPTLLNETKLVKNRHGGLDE